MVRALRAAVRCFWRWRSEPHYVKQLPPLRRIQAKLHHAGMLRLMGAVTEKTLVVTSVSDSQVRTCCGHCLPAAGV